MRIPIRMIGVKRVHQDANDTEVGDEGAGDSSSVAGDFVKGVEHACAKAVKGLAAGRRHVGMGLKGGEVGPGIAHIGPAFAFPVTEVNFLQSGDLNEGGTRRQQRSRGFDGTFESACVDALQILRTQAMGEAQGLLPTFFIQGRIGLTTEGAGEICDGVTNQEQDSFIV